VLAATVGGFLALDRAFRRGTRVPATPPVVMNGPLVVVQVDDANTARSTAHLELVPLDGSAPTRLTPDGPAYAYQGVSASPDGRTIAYAVGDGGDHATIVVMDLSTGEQRDLVKGAVAGPAWSPDGKQMAYWDYGDAEGIRIVPADGSGEPSPPVPGSAVGWGEPSWSPDGSSVTFEERDVPGGPAVVTIDLESGRFRVLGKTDGDVSADPVWSPDGSQIIYAVSGGIWSVAPTGGEPTLLLGTTRDAWAQAGGPATPRSPTWSPDGRSVAYALDTADWRSSDIYIDALDGSEPRLLTSGTDFAWLPATAPSSGEPTPTEQGASSLTGVPFAVCRPMSIPGEFGPGLDTAWVFEKAPDAGCDRAEGFQYLGIGTADSVARFTGPIRDIGQNETELWPWATPDVDGDGIDEIALGIGSTGGSAQFVLFATDGSEIHLLETCAGCGYAFSWGGPGGHLEGAYCAGGSFWDWNLEHALGTDRYAGWLIEFRRDGWRLVERSKTEITAPLNDPSAIPDGGGNTVCGTPLFAPEDFPDYPTVAPMPPVTPSITVAPASESLYIGLDFQLCDAARLDGIDFLGDGTSGAAWAGTRARPDGSCPRTGATPIVAIDHTGDGLADAFDQYGLPYCIGCRPFGTTDLSGDGSQELIVVEQDGTEVQYAMFEADIREGGVWFGPVFIVGPGDPDWGFKTDDPFSFWAGGDEGRAEFVECTGDGGTTLVLTQRRVPIDGHTITIHETRLQMVGTGSIQVIGTSETTAQVGDPLPHENTSPTCGGLDFDPWA